ncbi:MAG: D-alanyl-D-alanine carboxypeptidase family protein [Clostridia bacterium]|nr:D-alanyl-D-alanine carboxypeptidase family protein [Clostridia bacterium]
MNNNRQPNNGWQNRPNGNNVNNTQNTQRGQQSGSRQNGAYAQSQQNRNAGRRTAGTQNNRPQQPRQQTHSAQSRRSVNGSSMSRITSQTPNQRRSERDRVKLTAEQIEINRVNRQREKYYIKKRRSARIKTYFSRFVLFLVVFAVMAGLCAALLFVDLTRVDSTDSSRYSYVIGDEKYSLPYTKAVRGGRVYVSFTDIAEMLDLAVTGSVEDMKYVIKGDEAETIRFVTDSRVVYVNDVETRLGAECYFEDDELYVPVDFVSTYFKGLSTTVDERAHKVTVEREITNLNENGKLDKNTEPEYAELSFLLQSPFGLDPLDEEEEAMASLPDLGFVTNLTVYEDYMNPGNTTEFLTLVNINNKLGSDYTPQDLMSVSATRDDGRAMQQLRENAAMALEALFREMKAAGYEDVTVTSAYRSYAYQEYLYNYYLDIYKDPDYVASISNPPGSSEHQTGLALDMHNLDSADIAFGNTDVFKWLKENCWKFGFILRYPQDKVDITGISWEPWHYRYVGRYHAQRMYQMNMCLEEYVEYIGSDS